MPPDLSPIDVFARRVAAPPVAAPVEAVLAHDSIRCDGVEFRRVDAQRLALLSICRRPASRAAGTDAIDVPGRLSPDSPIQGCAACLSIDPASASAASIAGPVRAIFALGGVPIPIRLTPEAVSQQLRADELKLLRISVDPGDLLRSIDRSPIESRWWFAWGNAAGIVHDVILVVESALARAFDRHGNVELAASRDGAAEATFTGGRGGRARTTIRLEPGVCVAYRVGWSF